VTPTANHCDDDDNVFNDGIGGKRSQHERKQQDELPDFTRVEGSPLQPAAKRRRATSTKRRKRAESAEAYQARVDQVIASYKQMAQGDKQRPTAMKALAQLEKLSTLVNDFFDKNAVRAFIKQYLKEHSVASWMRFGYNTAVDQYALI
jgi:hypothetical protein